MSSSAIRLSGVATRAASDPLCRLHRTNSAEETALPSGLATICAGPGSRRQFVVSMEGDAYYVRTSGSKSEILARLKEGKRSALVTA
jgi:hypothetical protein